ncbi:MAG: OmpH family outer membrane protein [Rhodanobacter sp.]|jgi:Skp family chaperone for outer membrane proteins
MNLLRSSLAAALIAVTGLSIVPVSSARAADELGGNPVAGMCLLSREAIFAQAKVGKAASQRLEQLAEQARSQIAAQRKPLDADIQSFQQKSASLSDAQRQQQGAALQKRMQTFQAQARELGERIQLTRAKAMQRIGEDAQPILASSYKSHQCGLLLNRDSALGGNMANDLTADVVHGLDRKITTISFNLEPLPVPVPSSNGK